MLQRIQSYIEQFHMFADVDDIVAGVSGGADSMCLLRVLLHLQNRYGYRLSVVHIHHGIRGEEADRDASFVQKFCDAHGIGCEICKFDVPAYAKAQKMTEEEAGRKLRYDAFCEAAGRCEKSAIAVAHHMEDQAETLLYRLARGTGIKGLSGMAAVSRYREIPLLRPLLCLHREEILTLLAAWEQPYCVDATNESLCYARNRIRKEVLPSLCQINEEAVKHMVMVCEQAGEISEYLSSQAQKVCEQFLEHLQGDTGQGQQDAVRFPRAEFLRLPQVLQKEVLRQMIGQMKAEDVDGKAAHILAAQRLLLQGQAGEKSVSFGKGLCGVLRYDWFYVEKEPEQKPEGTVPGEISTVVKNWDKTQEIPKKNYTKVLDYDKIKGILLLRTAKPGDRFTIDASGHQKKLSRFFIDEKIPRPLREQIPLLCDGEEIIWIIGYRVNPMYYVTEHTKRIVEVTYKESLQE